MAQAAQNSEAVWRATIELAKIDGRADPAKASADLLPLVTILRSQGNRRLLADALTTMSQFAAAQRRLEEANRLWDEAHKIYSSLDHPSKRLDPSWLYPSDSEVSHP
jgi:hypothetical protein